MKDFTVFWGCTIPARFPFLEKSVRTVLDGMGLPYRDIDGFTCCPEKSLVNNIDHGLWTLTAARNIAVAEGEGLNIVSPCTGCVSNLATVKSELKTNQKKKAEVNGVFESIGRKYEGKIKLSHLVPFFHDEVGANAIKSAIKRDFRGMKFAVHYGCHMMRPGHALKNDDPLDPKKFDNLIRTLGGESMDYMTKLTCCGQGLVRHRRRDGVVVDRFRLPVAPPGLDRTEGAVTAGGRRGGLGGLAVGVEGRRSRLGCRRAATASEAAENEAKTADYQKRDDDRDGHDYLERILDGSSSSPLARRTRT